MIKNILLTGKPGVGKTTALKAAIGSIGERAGGFYTGEVRAKGERTGFNIITLSGEIRMMASKTFTSSCTVGSYGVDVGAIDTLAAGAIDDAVENKSLVVIDEIGKMELFSNKFQASVLRALDSDKPVLGVIMERPNEFADRIKARADVQLVEVTRENRDRLPTRLGTCLEKLLHARQ